MKTPDPAPERDETPAERADRNWGDILQELRIAQTGTQIISGFLLTVAFQPRFRELSPAQVTLYLVLVCLAAATTIVGLAPVSLHRVLFARNEKARMVRIASRLMIADLVLVSVLTGGVVLLTFSFVASPVAGIVAGAVAAAVLLVVLVVVPFLARRP